MLESLQIEALAHNCAACGNPFLDTHLVLAAYRQRDIHSFEKQLDIGLLGAKVRNIWTHLDCLKASFKVWNMVPDIHQCIRCKKPLLATDMIQPVFQVVNSRAVNPYDLTDVGIALNDRVYFVHCDCTNPGLNKHSTNILIAG